MTAEENVAALRRARDAWNQGNLDQYLALYDPGVVLHGYQGVEPGMDSVRQFYRGFWEAFPGSQLTFDDELAAGDRVAVRFHVEGEHRGALMGISPTGTLVMLPGITILRFVEGKCVERWSQADFLGLLVQLGAVPAPG